MRRPVVAVVLGALMLSLVSGVPGAQARTEAHSTSCALSSVVKFRPGLVEDHGTQSEIRFGFTLSQCQGGGVTSATGFGGGVGKLRCSAGRAVAKAEVYWNTGKTSGLNFIMSLTRRSLHGQVVDGLFKGERMSVTNLSIRPLRGDCVTSPLTKAKVKGTLGL